MGRIAVAAIVSLWLVPISFLVNRVVPDPYMDEIFHVPQAQQYCKGNFSSWDPMITTPPGLILCYEIMKHVKPYLDDWKATLQALVLSLYPLHWFFSFLYYTDVASLTAVLAMYLLSLKRKYFLSSLLGALSVLIRQTNILWMVFVACTGVIEFIQSHRKDNVELDMSKISKESEKLFSKARGASETTTLRKRRSSTVVDSQNKTASRIPLPTACSSGLINETQEIIRISRRHFWKLFVSFSPFFAIFLAFAVFVFWNGGIVLGAKDAHAVSPHFSQLLYYSLISAMFMVPDHFTLDQAAFLFRRFCMNNLSSFSQLIGALIFGLLSVKMFSIAHPYLLADNRHYPFYLWRKVINFHWSTKYLMVPLYIYSWFSIINNLARSQKKIWVLAYFLACAGTLVPTPLIEFRYYTIPFFFLILHSPVHDNKSWLIMGTLYIGINFFTMLMFLFRPFSWSHESGQQRFIW